MPWVEYTPRFLTPTYLEQARDNPLNLGVYRDGALAAPTALGSSISVYSADNVEVVSAAAIALAGSQATYTVLASALTSQTLGSGWRIEWTLVMPDTYTHLYRADASLVRVRLNPVITDLDLVARHSDLAALRPSTMTSYQGYIDEAWRDIVGRLESVGRRPYLVISPEALRPIHLYRTLSMVFRDFGGTGDPENKWNALAEYYEKQYSQAWSTLSLVYDERNTGDGVANRRIAVQPTVWLSRARGGATLPYPGGYGYPWPR